ncbi:MAG: hypothetical protein LBD84_03865 [Campylobacteraceae bacterium]|jgi:hypothetical protein|nr:hypothetical protein [Campylobacteraceae bacterium]
MKTMNFKSGDIIVCASHSQDILKYIKNHFIVCETQHAFERPHDMGEVFIDTGHLNKIGNQKIAELLFQTILDNHLFDTKAEVIRNDIADCLKTEVVAKDAKVNDMATFYNETDTEKTKVNDKTYCNCFEAEVNVKKSKTLSKSIKLNIIPKE